MRATGGLALRLLKVGALPLSAALVLAGCASMPSSGEVRKVDNGQQADADAQVRVFGIAPHPGESPTEIVSGFLEATTSGETDFATAKKYLTTDFGRRWNPLAGITVLSEGPHSGPSDSTDAGSKATQATVGVSGSKEALVDAKHAYRPDQGGFHTTVDLVNQGGEWRISRLENGLILSDSDFQRIYHSVNMYYFAELGSDAQRSGTRKQTLVADPVFLRQQQTDSLASTVSALLGGPTTWLDPAVVSAAPAGLRIYGKGPGQGVTLDDSQQHLKVRLNKSADRLGGDRCRQLAAQIFATLQGPPATLASVEMQRADGAVICSLTGSQARKYGPANLAGTGDGSAGQYFIGSEQHQLYELTNDTSAIPVRGPFGSAKANLEYVAVRRDEQTAAGVTRDGRRLVVGSLTGNAPVKSELTSSAHDPKNGLSAPSWDGFGDLWVADRNPAVSRLYVLRNGTGEPATVDVPDLDGRVESLHVASDGVRIALVVDEGGVKTLQLGRIERGGTLEEPQFTVTGLRRLTPAGETVSSVSWAGASRLVMLGSDVTGGGQQIKYVRTDGSKEAPALQSIGEAVSVAASEDQGRPLLASYNGSVYWLPVGSNWKKVTPKGGSPVYPG